MCERCDESEGLTVGFECQRGRRAQDPRIRHRVLHQADVASHVGGLHLGDVQVSCVLGDEATTVLGHEWGELIKHPAVDDLCRGPSHRKWGLEKSKSYLWVRRGFVSVLHAIPGITKQSSRVLYLKRQERLVCTLKITPDCITFSHLPVLLEAIKSPKCQHSQSNSWWNIIFLLLC